MRKMLVALAMTAVLFVALIGCSSGSSSASSSAGPSASPSSSAVSSPSSSESASSEAPELSGIEQFIEAYNASEYQTEKLVPGETFDPQDKSGDHYRTEFRLSYWSGSKGLACSAGDVSVDIIEPKPSMFGNANVRVYASGPEEGVVEFYRTTAHVLDPEVSDEAVEAAIQKGLDGSGNGLQIDDSDLNTILLHGEAMLEVA